MELMKQPWDTVMLMPYKFFMDSLKWKIDLEDEKVKHLENKTGRKSSAGLVKGVI